MEVGVTIIVACLPPLRTVFDKFLEDILPESLIGRASKTQGLPSFAINNYNSNNQTRTGATFVEDTESEGGARAEEAEKKYGQIVKNIQVTVSNDEIFGSDEQPRT
jgi:hypothetical protein